MQRSCTTFGLYVVHVECVVKECSNLSFLVCRIGTMFELKAHVLPSPPCALSILNKSLIRQLFIWTIKRAYVTPCDACLLIADIILTSIGDINNIISHISFEHWPKYSGKESSRNIPTVSEHFWEGGTWRTASSERLDWISSKPWEREAWKEFLWIKAD